MYLYTFINLKCFFFFLLKFNYNLKYWKFNITIETSFEINNTRWISCKPACRSVSGLWSVYLIKNVSSRTLKLAAWSVQNCVIPIPSIPLTFFLIFWRITVILKVENASEDRSSSTRSIRELQILRKFQLKLIYYRPLSFSLRYEVKAIYTLIAVYRRSLPSREGTCLFKRREHKLSRSFPPFFCRSIAADLKFQKSGDLIFWKSLSSPIPSWSCDIHLTASNWDTIAS